jgi:hypothetical protein
MILQGINELFGGIKDKREGKAEFNKLQKERDDKEPRISTIAQEDLINPYDRSMVDRMEEGALTANINKMSAAGRNPLTLAKLSSDHTGEMNQNLLNIMKFTDDKTTKARDAYKSEEISVMDKKWSDFLGREKRSLDKIQQGKERISGGFGALDSAITSVATMGISSGTQNLVADAAGGGTGGYQSPTDPEIDPVTGLPV